MELQHGALELPWPAPDSSGPGPTETARPLRGLAAVAAASDRLDERNDVEYFDLPCRSVLNRCSSSRMPFDFTINPYRGCEFGCTYCYARYTHEFLELPTEEAFERKIYVKRNAAASLASELARRNGRPLGPIAIGTATDPYQPAERRLGITREILATLARHSALEISITTKSDLVLRDTDLLRKIAERNSLCVNVTVTTLDSALARTLEPRAPEPSLRLTAVARLSEAGLRVGVFGMPILPFLTDDPASLRRLLFGVAEARAHYFLAQVLFLRDCSRPTFFGWLERVRPELVPIYRSIYSKSAYAPVALAEKIKRLIDVLRVPYGLASTSEVLLPRGAIPRGAASPSQIDLFAARATNRTG
jgi:DNA repair photolyase